MRLTTGGIPASDLISVHDIDQLLTSQPLLRSDMIRLVQQGEILPRNAYLRSMREVYPRPVDHAMTENEHLFEMLTRGVASAAEVTAAVRGGATLILQSAHWYHPPLTEFCRSLELALGRWCRANVYRVFEFSGGVPLVGSGAWLRSVSGGVGWRGFGSRRRCVLRA